MPRRFALPTLLALPLMAGAQPHPQSPDEGCVLVEYFARDPIRSVSGADGPARAGALNGRYVVRFENGGSLALRSAGELSLQWRRDGRPEVQGRLATDDYLARVVDREGSARETEAAKALAVAARSYLRQHARPVAGCRQVTDSSTAQRVSPNPATAEALAIVRSTGAMVVEGARMRHGGLAWRQAVAQSRQGKRFDEVLAAAFPGGRLVKAGGGDAACQRLVRNETWLAQAVPRWQRLLATQAGYEAPATPPMVCALAQGTPYSEQSRNRIFMRPLATREDRITLAHEYLHLGLRLHPHGQDEAYVERLARRLVDIKLEAP